MLKVLYELLFEIEASEPGSTNLFDSIAQHFELTG